MTRRSFPEHRHEPDVEVDEPVEEVIDRTDGSKELDQRATFQLLVNDPAARNYLFAAFAALAMIFLIMFQTNRDIGGLLIIIIGACGVLLRWTAAPAFVLIVLTYFMVFPLGIPRDASESPLEIEDHRFAIEDVLLVMSVVVYLACQYRIYGLVYQAVALEGSVRRKEEPPTRRPPGLITPTELGMLLAVSAAVVLAGQLIWLFVTAVRIAPGEDFPLKAADTRIGIQRYGGRGELPPGLSRFFLLVGLLFFGTLIARLVFGYWRLRTMTPVEGAMVLVNGGWDETKRERVRLEKWRIWGRKRAEAKAKEAEKTK